VAEKSHYYPTPCTAQHCEGEGEGGCQLNGPEDLLNKNVSYTLLNYHQKHTENDIFNEKL
jgi:hypothetical protein